MEPVNTTILKSLETSLINYLLQKKEVEEKVSGGFRRVRGLVLSLKKNNYDKYVVVVQIGMCECQFNAYNGLKEQGSIFGIERLIVDWLQRPSVIESIKSFVNNDVHSH